jgi:hypothetical protein
MPDEPLAKLAKSVIARNSTQPQAGTDDEAISLLGNEMRVEIASPRPAKCRPALAMTPSFARGSDVRRQETMLLYH